MIITVISRDEVAVSVHTGNLPDYKRREIRDLNNNSVEPTAWTYESFDTTKTLSEIITFLETTT